VRCLGASIRGSELVLVTVLRTDTEFTVESSTSMKLKLKDSSDRETVRAFYAAVAGFARNHNIVTMAVRGRQEKGEYAGSPVSFKIEGFLQVLENCSTTILMPTTIKSRVQKHGLTLPPGAHKYQEDAFFAACAH